MRYWLISDTHNHHRELKVPDGIDVVIHCGDESTSRKDWKNELESRAFFEWYSALEIDVKIFVPGNHSVAIEQGLVRPEQFPKVCFLIHDQIELEGLVIFGTPYTPTFFDWAFMRDREKLDIVWQSIPENVDLLITHGPPKGYMDVTSDANTREPIHVGSLSLTRQVKQRIKPIVHAFGHIHDEPRIRNFGIVRDDEITFINCSCCTLRSQLVNHGMIVDIDPATRSIQSLPQG
jgi:Icc-related predicted phosphoesterase